MNWEAAAMGEMNPQEWADALERDMAERSHRVRAAETPRNPTPGSDTVDRAVHFLARVADTLREKNKAYGDSASNPVRIFSKADAAEGIRIRLDDKISRLARGSEFLEQEDVLLDMAGYIALLYAVTDGKGR
ncbi:MAG: hypothetical protein M3R04_02425 [bacterium]|nr:hypothetical protein [bacterium]